MLDEGEKARLRFFENDIVLEQRSDDGEISVKTLGTDQLLTAIKNIPVDSGWLPEGVKKWGMADGETWFIAFYPSGRKKVWIENHKRKIEIPVPGMVFAGRGTTYWLFAAKSDVFSPEMELFWLRMPNFFQKAICWGNNKVLRATPENIEAMWKLYWNAPFTEGGIETIQELAGEKAFPENLMAKRFGKAQDLAKQISRKVISDAME